VKPEEPEQSYASADFPATDEAQPFNSENLEFAYEGIEGEEIIPDPAESSPAFPVPAQSGSKKRYLGMTVAQLALLSGMFVVEICVLIGFAFFIFQTP